MRISSHLGYVLSTAAALALLAGCSGGGGSSSLPAAGAGGGGGLGTQSVVQQHTASHSVLPLNFVSHHPATKKAPFVNGPGINALHGNQTIISDAINNTVGVFGGAGQMNAQLTSGLSQPQGIATDNMETLYVANTANSNILVYPKPYMNSSMTLDDSGQYPAGVAVDNHTGVVGVSNIISTAGGAGSVSFYAKGATTPCATVGNGNWGRVYFVGFDAAGNLYIDGTDPNFNVLVGVVSGECSATSITTLTTGNTIFFPGGVQVNHAGNVTIGDQTGLAVYTYAPPSGGSLGSPLSTTSLGSGCDPVTYALMEGNQNLWTADACLAQGQKYTYPAGGTSIKQLNGGFAQPIGVAVNPNSRI